MKLICLALGVVVPVILAGPAFSSANDEPSAAPSNARPQVVVLRSVADPGGAEHDVVMEVKTEVNGEDGEVGIHVTPAPVFASVAAPADPNRGWLGVQLGEVPPALAAHLPTSGGAGILVGNIVKGSPADLAGLQQHDVITAVDGKSVTGDIGRLSEIIGSLAPGSKVAIKALREGKEVTLQATLASRPSGEEIEWIHEFAPDTEIHESFKTRGKILRRGADGKIVLEELGDLEALKNLPDDIKAIIPRMDQFTTRFSADDDNRSFTSSVSRDGVAISVKQDGGGPIEVERTDKDGNTTEATYADAEALKTADPEAFEVYEEVQDGMVLETSPGGQFKTFHLFHPQGAGAQAQEQWREEIEKAMREAREAMKEAGKSVDESRKRLQFRFRNVPGHPFFSWNDEDADGPAKWFDAHPGVDGRSFRVNPDGQIEVIIRKGDTEVTKVFKDEGDLAARDPQLHEAYTQTLAEGED